MHISLSKHGSSVKACLSESLEIQCASDAKGPLMDVLESCPEVEYDLELHPLVRTVYAAHLRSNSAGLT